MIERLATRRGGLQAYAVHRASHFFARHPDNPVVKRIMGDATAPYYATISGPDHSWLEVPGHAGRRPATYGSYVVLGTPEETVERWVNNASSEHMRYFAAAYALGGVAMAAHVPTALGDRVFHPEDPGIPLEAVAMRLGKGPLRATLGVFEPASESFFPFSNADDAEGVMVLAQDISRQELDERFAGTPIV